MRTQAKALATRRPAWMLIVLAGLMALGLALLVRPLVRLAQADAPSGAHRAVGAPTSAQPFPSLNVVRIQVEHTLFHPMDNVVLQVERMDGRMVGQPGRLISLDDRNSFSVQIDQAVTRLSARDLSALINSYLLKKADSAVRHVDVSFDGQRVVVKGKVHKLVDLPFEGRGVLSPTPQGELRMHMEEFKVAGVLSRGFLAFFGIRLDDVAQPEHKASFRVEGDDFITQLEELFPAPHVYGRLTRVHVEGQDLVQVIGVKGAQAQHHAIKAIPRALPEPANYIYFTGGRMHFGRMTMENVDLKLVDIAPGDAFDFSLDHYEQQIQAGYVKVLPTLGIVVYAPGWSTLAAHRRR
jgi:hypothetical protein